MSKTSKIVLAATAIALGAAVSLPPVRTAITSRVALDDLQFLARLMMQRIGMASAEPAPRAEQTYVPRTEKIELEADVVPFREIGARLGPRALHTNLFVGSGVVVFDANGDGRLDLYFPKEGRVRAKKSLHDGTLTDDFVQASPCVLFLNMGNDDDGSPVFESIQELERRGNGKLVRQELLIENKYAPRGSVLDDEYGPGRIARGAISADFDGDGLMDLMVANDHYGLPYQTHEYGLRVYPSMDNLGRKARGEPVLLRQPPFLRAPLADGLTETVEFGGRREPEGRNTLYRNLGDSDGDGIPEWQDVTDQAGVGGRFASLSITVADIDRDGDLDFYVSNFLDSDFWGFSTSSFAGNRNELYINQLTETGRFVFKEAALEWGVSGLHDEEGLAASMRFPDGREFSVGEQHYAGRKVGEKADHSWAAKFVDWNDDGWPDLVVANDEGNRLRVYENDRGRRFRRVTSFDDPRWNGCWMAVSQADFDGDLRDDLFISNCGGQTITAANTGLLVQDEPELPIHVLTALDYMQGRALLHHVILSYVKGKGLVPREPVVRHSPYIPPELTRRANFAPRGAAVFEREKYAAGLASYEFGWGSAILDVDNDGRQDVYWAGGLARGNDGFYGDSLGSPGRLLRNESENGEMTFRDMTLEYRLLDITDMDYDANPPRRKAPGTGWHKRDYIYLLDSDSFMDAGLKAAQASSTTDLFRMHEAATGVVSADLNGDGYEDIVVTHMGGYDSNSPQAKNLKTNIMGRLLAIPSPNQVYRAPTNFEEGKTFVYISSGPRRGTDPNWVSIRLLDRTAFNRYAVGARVLINGSMLRRLTVGGATWSGTAEDLTVGLGRSSLQQLEITWPSGEPAPQRIVLDRPVSRATVCIDRQAGRVTCPSNGRLPEEAFSSPRRRLK